MLFHEFASRCLAVVPLAPRTRSDYLGVYRRYLKEPFGHRLPQDITRSDVLEVLAALPPQTAYRTLMVFRTISRELLEHGIIEHSPAERIKAPRIHMQPRRFLTWEEIIAAEFGPHGRYSDHVRFLALHGLRWSEALVLGAGDIRDGRVHIERSVNGPTKSSAGVRTVPYLGHFRPFTFDRRALYRALAPFQVTIHSLRKTYAYILKCSGVHVTTAQRLMGHASPSVTLGIYTQVLDDEIDAAGESVLRRVLGGGGA